MRGRAAEIIFTVLVAINLAGALALAWVVAYMLYWDRVMAFELTLCAGLIAVLAAISAGAFALRRRGWIVAAFVLLAVGALPTAAVGGLFLYLEYNPIMWQ